MIIFLDISCVITTDFVANTVEVDDLISQLTRGKHSIQATCILGFPGQPPTPLNRPTK
jgi:hypothetical protein